jgi:hypothetical protein
MTPQLQTLISSANMNKWSRKTLNPPKSGHTLKLPLELSETYREFLGPEATRKGALTALLQTVLGWAWETASDKQKTEWRDVAVAERERRKQNGRESSLLSDMRARTTTCEEHQFAPTSFGLYCRRCGYRKGSRKGAVQVADIPAPEAPKSERKAAKRGSKRPKALQAQE